MPLVRLARAAAWLARTDAKTFLAFLLVSPMYLLAACYWSFGFYQGATRAPIEEPAQVR